MSPAEVLEALVALCREAGLEVRRLEGGRESSGEPTVRSAVCRVRGRPWLVLCEAEGLEERIAAAADALRRFAPDFVEGRYLPPAVRQRLGSRSS
jgi:hypothetical protein